MRPPHALLAALATAAATLAVAAPAHAAFAPAVDVTVDPPQPGAVPALSAVVTQLPGETPIRSLALRLPPGFALNLAWAGTLCPDAAAAAGACPAESRIGAVHLVTALGATASGPVNLAPDGRLLAFASGAAGILDQTLTGRVQPRSGGIQVALAGLPALPLRGIALRLDGGARGAIRNPDSCGEASVMALLTSHRDELAAAPDTLRIAGCAAAIVARAARVRPARFHAVRRRSDRGRRGYGTRLTWRQSDASGPTRVLVERRAGRRWRRAGSLLASARPGANALRFDGRLRGRPLRPGAYRFRVVPRDAARGATARFTVLR